ncbi:hypothetical protein [Candidatus Deianiraea vastatrix]|nr:hypothetical protein [Candidatus Deianiraea vastatrix]
MPNTKTAEKNLRKNKRNAVVNKSNNTAIKNLKKDIVAKVANIAKPGVNVNDVVFAIKSSLGKLHSKSRKNTFDKLRASNFERKIVLKIKNATHQ